MAQLNSDEVKHNTLLRQSCLDKIHNHECSDDDEALLVLRSDSDDMNQKTKASGPACSYATSNLVCTSASIP